MATILIVDDDEGLRVILTRVLQADGHVIVTEPNGTRAAEAVRSSKADLLLTDIFMPDKEGLGTIEEVRRLYPTLPIIAMSGGGAGRTELWLDVARKMGAKATLTKPFSMEEVRRTVKDVLGPPRARVE